MSGGIPRASWARTWGAAEVALSSITASAPSHVEFVERNADGSTRNVVRFKAEELRRLGCVIAECDRLCNGVDKGKSVDPVLLEAVGAGGGRR